MYTRFHNQNFIFKEGRIKVNCSYKVMTETDWFQGYVCCQKLLFMFPYLFLYHYDVGVSYYAWFMARLAYVH
jgi:hypothetical protein